MDEHRWHDAAKDKLESEKDVLVCFSGNTEYIRYDFAYSVGCYWAEDGEWELQEFGGVPPKGIRVHVWKGIEPFGLEE